MKGAPALRIGIAGLGFGSGVHLPVFEAMEDVAVGALLGRDGDKTKAAAARCNEAIPCTSIDAFLDQKLDAVVVALPPAPAGELAAAALARGLAILAEKPIADSAAAATALAARSDRAVTAVDFEFRELDSFRTLHALLRDGSLGRVRAVNVTWRGMSYAQARRVWSWKTDAAAGGGVLTLSGLHLFNLLEWLFGPVALTDSHLSDAATRAFAPPDRNPAPDTADLRFRTETGIVVRAHLSNAAVDRHGHRWEIDTNSGRVIIDDGGGGAFNGFTLSHRSNGRDEQLARDPDRRGDYRIGPVSRLAQRFVIGVRNGVPVQPAFHEGARAQAILEQAYALA